MILDQHGNPMGSKPYIVPATPKQVAEYGYGYEYAYGGSAQQAGGGGGSGLPTLITVDTQVSNSDNATWDDVLSFDVEANKTYIVECILRTKAGSNNYRSEFQLSGVPSGASGQWTAVGAEGNGQVNPWFNAGPISQVLDGIRQDTDAAPTTIRILLVNGANAGTVTLQIQPETNGVAAIVEAGSVALVREEPSVEIVGGDITADSDTDYDDVFTINVGAGDSVLVDAEIIYESAAPDTGIAVSLQASAGTVEGMIITPGAYTDYIKEGVHRDDSTVHTADGSSNNRAYNVARIRALVISGGGAATLTIKVRSEVDASAITVKENSWAHYQTVTGDVQTSRFNNSLSTSYETEFSFSIEEGKTYWIRDMVGFTTAASDKGLSADIDSIPSAGQALFAIGLVANSSGGVGTYLVASESDDADPPSGPGATESPKWSDGYVQSGESDGGSTFGLRHKAETTAEIKAGAFAYAEEVEVM